MKKTRIFSLIALVLAMLMVFAACAPAATDNKSNDSEQTTPADTQQTEEPAKTDDAAAQTPAEPVTITYCNFNSSGGNEETLQKMVEAFEATHENIKIEVETIGYDDYITQIGGGPWKHYYGNKDLKPQKSNYYSASVEYHASNLQITVTGFYNRIKNMIALTEIPTSAEDRLDEIEASMQHKNLSKARSFGGDISLTYQILSSLAIGGGYSYTDAKAQYTDDPADPNYMLYTPINGTSFHNANWKLAWNHAWKKYKLDVTLFGRYQSTRFYITDGDGKSYQLWRLNTRHNVLKKKKWNLDINVGIDNIFDYVDRTPFGRHRGTTSPGRTWYASFIVKFQNKHKL